MNSLTWVMCLFMARKIMDRWSNNCWKNQEVKKGECAQKLWKVVMWHGNVKTVSLTPRALYAKSVLKKEIIRDIEFGWKRMWVDAAIAEILMLGAKMDFVLITRDMKQAVNKYRLSFRNIWSKVQSMYLKYFAKRLRSSAWNLLIAENWKLKLIYKIYKILLKMMKSLFTFCIYSMNNWLSYWVVR